MVAPKFRLPSLHPVNDQALEFNLPAIIGLGEKPAPVNGCDGLLPTVVCMLLEKSTDADGTALVSINCAIKVPEERKSRRKIKNRGAAISFLITEADTQHRSNPTITAHTGLQ